jgi:tetrapyrrole methylase family protein/MazG family protein
MTERSADITIVGLGPGDPERRTREVQRALDEAARIFVRGHGDVPLDDLLASERVTNLASMRQDNAAAGGRWRAAAHTVCDAAAESAVVLVIPGHPRFGEGLVEETLTEADDRGLTTSVLNGLSVVDMIATAVGFDPMRHVVQLFSAREVAADAARAPFDGGLFTGSPRRPMLFTHVYDERIIRGVAAALGRVFPADHRVTRVEAAGLPGERISDHAVGDLASVPGGNLVALWVPPLPVLDAGRDPRTLQHIVARLRQPDGCPWDRNQDNASLRNALIDEVYEAADAIDAGDMQNLAEELGDLFLLIAMHAQIAEEAGHFTLEDVYDGIATKIVRRHPHVFGDAAAEHAEEVVGLWQKIKAEERANGKTGTKAADGQPHSMPALERAARVLTKHPLAAPAPESDDPGDRLLAAIAGIIDAGDDPDAVLRAALERHAAQETSNS